MRFSIIEIRELAKAWIVISLAFGILLSGGLSGIGFTVGFLIIVLISAFTVGLGFLLHELAHKYFAQRYGCHAEFRAFDNMLFLALIMSFFGFILAAPGAVFIQGNINKARNGMISAAGPATNLVLGLVFFLLSFLSQNPLLSVITAMGFQINIWLGLFNMIPFGFFDGRKILEWNKLVYGALVASLLFLFILPRINF